MNQRHKDIIIIIINAHTHGWTRLSKRVTKLFVEILDFLVNKWHKFQSSYTISESILYVKVWLAIAIASHHHISLATMRSRKFHFIALHIYFDNHKSKQNFSLWRKKTNTDTAPARIQLWTSSKLISWTMEIKQKAIGEFLLYKWIYVQIMSTNNWHLWMFREIRWNAMIIRITETLLMNMLIAFRQYGMCCKCVCVCVWGPHCGLLLITSQKSHIQWIAVWSVVCWLTIVRWWLKIIVFESHQPPN